mmetsp:Transcript_61111/g.144220  ORF Transcript_61111/g.144220 Transcript_61111/m.144220 type:complete len:169 (+) Transcript_61111:214-720(+)
MGNSASSVDNCGVGCFEHRRAETKNLPVEDPVSDTPVHLAQLGIVWLVQENQLIVAGFAPGSDAERAGVRAGDILQEVDGISAMSSIRRRGTDPANHPAGKLMVGPWGTACTLKLCRHKESEEESAGRSVPDAEGAASPHNELVILEQVTCKVFRLRPLARRQPPHAG